MKRLYFLCIFTVFLALSFSFIQCSKGTKVAAGDLALLKMLPEHATGFVQIDFKKMAELGIIKSMLDSAKKDEAEKNTDGLNSLKQFISQAGVDPEKDLKGGALAVFEAADDSKPLIAFVAQGNIVPEKMIAYMKTQAPDRKEETIDGTTYYHMDKNDNENIYLCFPKAGIAAVGNLEVLKQTVSVIQGKAHSLMDNPRFNKQIKLIKADAIASAVFSVPEKIRSMGQEKLPPPFEFDMSKAEAFAGQLFYQSDVWSGYMALISANPEGNKKNANTLNSLKGFAAFLGPEVGEVVNSLQINADDKQVEIKFSITKAQLEKLSKKAQDSLSGSSADAPNQASTELTR